MDKELKKERFISVSIKASVAKKFKRYCKTISKSQSMTLSLMLEFFEENNLSPTESLGPNMKTLENSLKKRINSMIAIIKDIEKTQTKPTAAILNALLEQAEPQKKPLMLEKKRWEKEPPESKNTNMKNY